MPGILENMNAAERMDLRLAVQQYVETSEAYDAAANAFNNACDELRKKVKSEGKGIVCIGGYKRYLVTVGKDKSFEVVRLEEI